ncbi:hypothetical protein [Planomonospora venezuelensis]|uniref:Uncharacterized protein n=1 Tax=Planomonospora venezuelensis TaxID=1999 RepID=A0A841D9P0_PLAVE|nr:hypothetical protein [Planomonospora venezuelensis]MBB5966209.1 hypothetical protein [Planomonospora venezuelensis]
MALIASLGGCVTPGSHSTNSCLSIATKESAFLRESIEGSLPKKESILSIDNLNGCDSSNNGAWLSVNIDISISEKEIIQGFVNSGWSYEVDKWKKCGNSCDADLAKKVKGRVVGMTLTQDRIRNESSMETVWEIVVDDLDDCWTDEGYNCR